MPRSSSAADDGEPAQECKGKAACPEEEWHVDSGMGEDKPDTPEPASGSVSISVPTSGVDEHEKKLVRFRKEREALRKQMKSSAAAMKAEKRKRHQLVKKLSGIKTHDLVVMCAMRGLADGSQGQAKAKTKANAKRSAKKTGPTASDTTPSP